MTSTNQVTSNTNPSKNGSLIQATSNTNPSKDDSLINDEFINNAAKGFNNLFKDVVQDAKKEFFKGASTKALAIFAIKKGWDILKKWRENQEIEDKIEEAYKQYGKKYLQRHGFVKVLGMQHPEKLNSIYTFLHLLNAQYIRRFESVEELEKKHKQKVIEENQKEIVEKAAHKHKYLMVLGEPGAGKTTFLRKRGLEALQGEEWGLKDNEKQKCLPVFIELKRLASDDTIDINNLIEEELSIFEFDEDAKFFIEGALKEGKLLVLLDGLDEVPTEKMNEVIEKIKDFVDLYDKNRFIISCRTAAYRCSFPRFNDVVISYFEEKKAKQFVSNWFTKKIKSENQEASNKADECWDALQKNAAAKGLAQTPLMLTMLCLIYQRDKKFPLNRASLYEKALRLLLEEWAVEKGLPQKQVYKGLDTKRLEKMLSAIAHNAFQNERSVWTRREIVGQIETWLKQEVEPKAKFVNGEAILQSIYLQHGILVERAVGVYSFPHFTFQEYLTAQYIDDQGQSAIEKLVKEHLADSYWDDVFLFLAGLMRDGADELLNLMEEEAKKFLNTPTLQKLCRWAEEQTHGSNRNERAAKRITAVLLTRALDRAFDNSTDKISLNKALERPLAEYIKETFKSNESEFELNDALANAVKHEDINDKFVVELEKLKIFKNVNDVYFRKLRQELQQLNNNGAGMSEKRDRIREAWCKALTLNSSLICLDETDKKALENYARAYLLMAQCQKAAVRSPKNWDEIKEGMFLI